MQVKGADHLMDRQKAGEVCRPVPSIAFLVIYIRSPLTPERRQEKIAAVKEHTRLAVAAERQETRAAQRQVRDAQDLPNELAAAKQQTRVLEKEIARVKKAHGEDKKGWESEIQRHKDEIDRICRSNNVVASVCPPVIAFRSLRHSTMFPHGCC